jgi:hypothetical protein
MLGVASTAGYGPLLPAAFERATGMTSDGRLDETPSEALLDLLAVTHLTLPRLTPWSGGAGRCNDASDPVVIDFTLPEPAAVAALRVRSNLGCSVVLPDLTPVASFAFGDDGDTVDLLVGAHTAEWAYDRADVASTVAHARAAIAASFPAIGFSGYVYQGVLPLSGEVIAGGRVTLAPPAPAMLSIERIEALDAQGRTLHSFTPPDVVRAGVPAFTALTDTVAVARRGAAPLAWFVAEVAEADGDEAADAVRSGRRADGTAFSPLALALVPPGSVAAGPYAVGEVLALRRSGGRWEVEVDAASDGFLVLGRSYHPGWRAEIGGVAAQVVPTQAIATGIAVPPGQHSITLTFAPRDLLLGQGIAAGAALLALALALAGPLSASGWGRVRRGDRRRGS